MYDPAALFVSEGVRHQEFKCAFDLGLPHNTVTYLSPRACGLAIGNPWVTSYEAAVGASPPQPNEVNK